MISTIVKRVDASVLLRKPGRMRVVSPATAGILSGLLVTEPDFLLSEFRQASERQELVRKSSGQLVFCLESEVAVPDFEFPFLCASGAGVLVALALAVIFRPCALPVFNQE